MVRQLDDKVARLAAGLHGYRDMFSFGGLELQSMGFKVLNYSRRLCSRGRYALTAQQSWCDACGC